MRIISGSYKGRRIPTTSGPGYRPATEKVREALFSMLESRGVHWEGVRAADLFAGSGSLGLEALSRGASFMLFVEKNRRAARLIRDTLDAFGTDPARYRVHIGDVLRCVRTPPGRPFDLCFIDPPYGEGLLQRTLEPALNKGWFAPGGFVAAEVEETQDPQKIDLPGLVPLINRTYGQTRICIWRREQ